MKLLAALLQPAGPRRVLAAVTLISAIGKGIFLTTGVLYFSQIVRIPAVQVGLGLSLSGIIALVLGVPAGHLADRRGARQVYTWALAVGALATSTFLLVSAFWSFVLAVTVAAVALGAGLVVRGPIINAIAGDRPQELRAHVRALTNVGIAAGAALAGWAVQVDSAWAYRLLLAGNALCLMVAAVTTLRLPPVPPVSVPVGRPRWIALRDRPYIALSVLDGVLSIQYRVLTVALPLWLVTATSAPRWTISAAVFLNTAFIIVLQVRVGRTVVSPGVAGTVLRRSGVAFFLTCVVISLVAGAPPWLAVALLLVAVVVHSMGELWQAAGGFEVSNVLAPPHAVGQYLGVFQTGMGLAESFGPALLTVLCISWGRPGWYVVGVLFLAAGLAVPPVVRWAEATRHRYATPAAAPPAGVPAPV